jgi:prolyl-tRNA editing enzyme YbaK/EbsC (Cys-tRNA(Pro) deacylase)
MLEDFIEVNKFDGKVLKFINDTSPEKALSEAKIPSSSLVKTVVFTDDKMDFYVVVANACEEVSILDAEDLFDKDLLQKADRKDVYNRAGVDINHFPPIGIFGARVILTEKVKKQKYLLFELSSKEFLVILTDDVIKAIELTEELI